MTETPIAPGSSFDTLHRLRRWVGWRWEVRKGVKTKPPRAPGSGRYASVPPTRAPGGRTRRRRRCRMWTASVS